MNRLEIRRDIAPSDSASQTTTAAAPSSETLPARISEHSNQAREGKQSEQPTEKPTSLVQEPAKSDPEVEPPPNGGYGWVCVVCCALINAHTWGINSSYGVFLSYYLANNVFPGATDLDYALIGGLSIAAALLVSPIATMTTGHYGTRTTLLIGVFFETLSMIAASFAYKTWQLFLSQGACFGIGMGFLFVGSVGIIPQWFTTRRSLANGIGAGGSGIGGLTYSLATGAMIPRIGLAWTFRVLGIVLCVVNFTCATLLRDRNKIIGAKQVPFDYKLFKRPEYVLMEAWAFFSILGYVVLLFSLPSYVVSVGLTQQQAAVIGALLNLGQGLGRPVVGMFSDVGGRINLAAILTAICGLFCFVIWIFAKSYGVLIFFSLIVGTVAGTIWTTIAPVAAEVVGLQYLPAALSMTWLVMLLPSAFSEAIGLEIIAATRAAPTSATSDNPYLYAQVYTALMYTLAAACAWFLRAWKIGELEMIAAQKGEDVAAVDPVADVPAKGLADAQTGVKHRKGARSGIVHRLFVWRRV